MKRTIAFIAHGGSGGIDHPHRRRTGLKKAVEAGYATIDQGGSSLDAVEKAAMMLEDATIFNAGTGSCLTLDGKVEMDASVMTSDLRFGAVGAISNVKNPICVARLVMERTDHLLLCGENATRFARLMSIRRHNPVTEEKKRIWKRKRKKLKSKYFPRLPDLISYYGTIGCVAIDRHGDISVATSSGGIFLKLPGRVADSSVLGAGTYADRNGGVSATGHGEEIMRLLLAFRCVRYLDRMGAEAAGRKALAEASKHGCRCGMVGIDKHGDVLCVHNTPGMSWYYMRNGAMRSF